MKIADVRKVLARWAHREKLTVDQIWSLSDLLCDQDHGTDITGAEIGCGRVNCDSAKAFARAIVLADRREHSRKGPKPNQDNLHVNNGG